MHRSKLSDGNKLPWSRQPLPAIAYANGDIGLDDVSFTFDGSVASE